MKTKTRYICEVCNKEYLLSGEARKCEASHTITNNPQFDMVQEWLKKSDKTVAKIIGETQTHKTLQDKIIFLEHKVERLEAQKAEIIKAYRYKMEFRNHLDCKYTSNKVATAIYALKDKINRLKCTISDREYAPLKKVIGVSEHKLHDPRVRELLKEIYDKLIILK